MTTPMPRLNVEDYQASPEVRRENETRAARRSNHTDPCFLCGRLLTERAVATAWFAHLATDGTLFAAEDTSEDVNDTGLDQGWFPMGSECATKVPRAYRARLNF